MENETLKKQPAKEVDAILEEVLKTAGVAGVLGIALKGDGSTNIILTGELRKNPLLLLGASEMIKNSISQMVKVNISADKK